MRRLTIIHPAIGHRKGENYIRSWQMEPLPAASIAGLTPPAIEKKFYDDRMEVIPFDEPTDIVAISVETYTAMRAYQIASEYRKRGVPVILGGFHATLCPDECQQYADALVVGEAENIWPQVMDDFLHGQLKKRYSAAVQPGLEEIRSDRTIFRNKRYLPLGLIETGRGCKFPCEFCAIQSFFNRSHRQRPVEDVVNELESLKESKKLFFFVDDNFAANLRTAKEMVSALAGLGVRWVTQMSINAAHDEEMLSLLHRSGCVGVLIGFESLNPETLSSVGKKFNTMRGGYEVALDNLRRFNIRVYGTFIFGLDQDNQDTFDEAVDFAITKNMYIAAFNHLTPFPGTPMYTRLEQEKRLRFNSWWTDPEYRYNDLPFLPKHLSEKQITQSCIEARKKFYSWNSIFKRGFDKTNRADGFMFRNFFTINMMHRNEISLRNGYPLGSELWQGELLPAR